MAAVPGRGLITFDLLGHSLTEYGVGAFNPVDFTPPVLPYTRTSDSVGEVTSALPISEIESSFTSWRMPTFLDDYYYRVHVLPGVLPLGNLLSSQVRNVEVWSAYFEPQLLSSVDSVGTDGLNLAEPEAAPTYFAALESRTYVLSVSTNGSPVIDAAYTFNFALDAPTLSVTGRRVVVWPFIPQTKHRERLEWKTDVLPSFNNEQRLALRPAPRQSFSYSFQLDPRQFSRAKAIATQWAHRVYGIPVWSETTRVGALSAGATEILLDTTTADYRENDIVLVWEDDTHFLAVENTGVLSDRVVLKLPLDESFTNAYVAPLRFSRTLQGMSFNRSAHDVVEAQATFQVTANRDLGASIGLPQYRGKDVLVDRTVLSGDLDERISRAIDVFDNGSGPMVVDVKNSWVTSRQTISIDTLTRAERWEKRKWLHSRRGKQAAFWLPSWNEDLVVLEDVGAAGAALTVSPIEYPLYYGVKDIMIQLKSGTRLFARVLSGATDPDGNEVLSLGAAVGTAFTVSEVDFVCFMSHVRFDTDTIEISHGHAGRAVASIPVTETPEE